jgi:ssDNA-binding Zn-finger/Zn-ribbon topoisomerase 1
MEELQKSIEKYKEEIRCPLHGCLIGKFDGRAGIINGTFYCPKCKFEYTFTIPAKKVVDKSQKRVYNKRELNN